MNYLTEVDRNCKRVAELGEWPAWIPAESLVERVPQGETKREGFDAGIACALDLIPRDKQKLSAVLHAAYTPEAVEQVRRELAQMRAAAKFPYRDGALARLVAAANTETCWWLIACSLCQEKGMDVRGFEAAIGRFGELSEICGETRVWLALKEADKMSQSFRLTEGICPPGLPEGIALATRDGGMQGAYICGHEVAIQSVEIRLSYVETADIWFIGTYQKSLEIPENFSWEQGMDIDGRPTSGPVHGSKAFVKAANLGELKRVLKAIPMLGLGAKLQEHKHV